MMPMPDSVIRVNFPHGTIGAAGAPLPFPGLAFSSTAGVWFTSSPF
jgi:hypothetical protein